MTLHPSARWTADSIISGISDERALSVLVLGLSLSARFFAVLSRSVASIRKPAPCRKPIPSYLLTCFPVVLCSRLATPPHASKVLREVVLHEPYRTKSSARLASRGCRAAFRTPGYGRGPASPCAAGRPGRKSLGDVYRAARTALSRAEQGRGGLIMRPAGICQDLAFTRPRRRRRLGRDQRHLTG